jgi:hypothetical protein
LHSAVFRQEINEVDLGFAIVDPIATLAPWKIQRMPWPVLAGFADLDHQHVLAHRFAGNSLPCDAAHRGLVDRDGFHGQTRRATTQL